MISWSSLGQDGSGWSVYARALQLDTIEFGPETLVNVTTAGDQYSFGIRGAIATNPAEITTVVWNGNGTGDSAGIFRRQFAIIAEQNQAPTLNLSSSGLLLPENADTSLGITVSSLNISDDVFGSNAVSLSGADAGAFEIVGTSLRLKPGPFWTLRPSRRSP